MKKRRKKVGRRFKNTAYQQSSKPPIIEMEPEVFVPYVRRAEQEVLPSIKEMKLGPGAAAFLLAQHAQVLVTGDPRLSVESAMAIAANFLALWQAGYYTPDPEYPYTLEETLNDVRGEGETKEDYSVFFQPFAPVRSEPPRGLGQVAGGIVRHPETQLWQIWMMIDGSYAFFGAYSDPVKAQTNLEAIINASRRGDTRAERDALFQQAEEQGDSVPKQLPYDLMQYLLEHIDLYQIQL